MGEDRTAEQLATAAQGGDRRALDELAERWWTRIRQWAFVEIGDRAAIDDASQDALVKLLDRIDRYDASRPFAPWLRALVRNTCRDQRRKARPTAQVAELADFRDPGRQVDLHSGAERALRAFASLTNRQRQVVELCDRQGLSPSEAAAELEIAPGTARSLLHQGRRRLRLELLAERPELLDLLRETA